MIRLRLFFVFILLNSCFVFGQRRNQLLPIFEKAYVGYHFDDDFLFLGNKDEQYTGGLDLEYMSAFRTTRSNPSSIFNPFPGGKRSTIVTLGSYLFTPNNIADSLIVLNDRPFSSLIYSSFGYVAYDKNQSKKLLVELYFGVMGADLPGSVQAKLHTVGDSPSTYGWRNKIMPTETLVANLHVNYQVNLLTLQNIHFLRFKSVQFAALTDIQTGLYLNRIGLGTRFSFFNKRHPFVKSLHYLRLNRKKTKGVKKINTQLYFSPQWQFVIQNTTLQGLPWIESPYIITENVLKRSVWDLEVGLNMYFKKLEITYLVKARSKEFTKYPRFWHSWAGITMGFRF